LILSLLERLGDVNRLLAERIDAGVIHRRRHVQGGRDEILDRVGFVAIAFEEYRQFDHRRNVAAGVRSDEVRDDELLLSDPRGFLFENRGEVFEIVVLGFPHFA